MSSINEGRNDRGYWRSLQEYADSPEFAELCAPEFPAGADEAPDAVSRRGFLKIMGASVALAGLSGCRWPRETIVPRSYRAAGVEPGRNRSFATAFELAGYATGLLVTSYDGRPIKVEGNPQDPISAGAADALAQASILELYDPDRSRRVHHDGHGSDWDAFAVVLDELRKVHAEDRGAGLRILSEASGSLILDEQRRRFLDAFPLASWHVHEALNRDNAFAGTAMAYGRPLRVRNDLAAASVILTLDADLLADHPAALAQARDFAAGRDPDGEMNRLYTVESRFTITGSMADHRLPIQGGRMEAFTLALAARILRAESLPAPAGFRELRRALGVHVSHQFDETFIDALVEDLVHARGRALVAAGERQPPLVHALVALINETLGSRGKTVHYLAPTPGEETAQLASLRRLRDEMEAGQVGSLVMLGGNPVYDAPVDLDFAGALAKVERTVHLSLHRNETSRLCAWELPRAHYLESWGDARAWDGSVLSVQPLIEPLYDGRSPVEIVAALVDGHRSSAHDLLRELLQGRLGADSGKGWRKLLHDGILDGSAAEAVSTGLQAATLTEIVNAKPANGGYHGLELEFHRGGSVHDGRFANNGWLQELPDPLSKITWDNAAAMGPGTAEELHLVHGDLVNLKVGGRELEAAVAVLPGHAHGCVSLALGYGREAAGRVGDGVGFDSYRLRDSQALHFATGLEVVATGGKYELAGTQDHYLIDPVGFEGRQSRLQTLVREGSLDEYREDPDFVRHKDHHPPLVSLWQEHAYEGHRWGMSIDLNTCIGCNACSVACQAENNIPVVGKREVARGREMSWIRMDRYFHGEAENPTSMVQPVACAQCELAPCEQVCPFQATTHSSEGLNDMVYNRCVGTRYCANNCPYKVRRFNYFNFHKGLEEVEKLAFNPEVSVRPRGVMEKCSYCVQRIQDVKIQAKNEGRPVADGEIQPACMQTCPTKAIRFGDLNDENSAVAAAQGDHRAYVLLEELNVKPRTAYLARVRNFNPKLASQDHEQHHHS
jgi:MoCo/4Fe-4S cofactor protein with predicted Tat translocation signal